MSHPFNQTPDASDKHILNGVSDLTLQPGEVHILKESVKDLTSELAEAYVTINNLVFHLSRLISEQTPAVIDAAEINMMLNADTISKAKRARG